jgi:hypothetical protein
MGGSDLPESEVRVAVDVLRPKVLAAAVVAVTVGLTTVACTGDDPPAGGSRPSPSMPGSVTGSSMTFDEAYQKLPMNGTDVLPISWELSGTPDVDEVLAARRSLVFDYWNSASVDWTPVIPIGRFLYTEDYYNDVLAPYAMVSAEPNPSVGPIWTKVVGVAKSSPDRAIVTFCTDLGYWHEAQQKNFKVRPDRAAVESYVMEKVQSGDGEQRWLADRHLVPDAERRAKYGAECTKWANHKP